MDLVRPKRGHELVNLLHIAENMKGITDVQWVKGLKFDIDHSTVRLKMRKNKGGCRPVAIRRLVTDNIE